MSKAYSPQEDSMGGIWGSHYNIPKAIFYFLRDYIPSFFIRNIKSVPQHIRSECGEYFVFGVGVFNVGVKEST